MKYFVPLYGLWCMGRDAMSPWADGSDLAFVLALIWQSVLLTCVGFLVWILLW